MAKRKKTNQKPGRAGKTILIAFAALLLCLAVTACVGFINADVVRIRRAEVVLPNLPESFDGTSVLYASDVDLCGTNTPEKCSNLFKRLQSLEPDLLILGGDYTSSSLLKTLNRSGNKPSDEADSLRARESFFHYIQSFDAPLGKFAIASPSDGDAELLRAQLEESGIHPLLNDRVEIRSGRDVLWLVGICEEAAGLNSAGLAFQREDCVLVTAFSPSILPVLLTSEASDSGQWADLVLCGHTHGGQIRLFGRSVLSLDRLEKQYLRGWYTESGLPILVTQGIGCEGVNLRLGSEPEVWLITLRRE